MTPRMTNEIGDAERLAIAYAPATSRARYRALLGLDATLRRIALSAREPLPAQLRLAWWRDACARLNEAQGHPVLEALRERWPHDPATLVALVDGWEELVAADDFVGAAETLAMARGAALAACAGASEGDARDAARAWTLAALSHHAPGDSAREQMRATVRQLPAPLLPRALRPLAVLAGLARRAVDADRVELIGDRWSPLVAMRLGIFGR